MNINDLLKEQTELWEKINNNIELTQEEQQRFNENKIIISEWQEHIILLGDNIK